MKNLWLASGCAIVILALASGCGGRGTDEASRFGGGNFKSTDVTFAVLKGEILSPTCIRCHGEFEEESGVLAHVNFNSPLKSAFYSAVQTGRMPRGEARLTEPKVDLVRAYVENAARAGAAPEPVLPVDGQVDFAMLKRSVLTPHCMACHSAWVGDEAKVAKRLEPGNSGNSKIYKRVSTGDMPRDADDNGVLLSAAKIEMLRAYIDGLPPVAPSPSPSPTPTPTETTPPILRVDFATLAREILTPHCMTCHAAWAGDEAKVARRLVPGNAAESRIYKRVAAGEMPQDADENGILLPADKIALLKAYIDGLPPVVPTPTPAPAPAPAPAPTSTATPAPSPSPAIEPPPEPPPPVSAASVVHPALAPAAGLASPLMLSRRVTWPMVKASLIDVSCLQCHGPGNPRKLPALDSYRYVRDNATGFDLSIEERINLPIDGDGVMPPARPTTVPRPSAAAKADFRAWIQGGFLEQ